MTTESFGGPDTGKEEGSALPTNAEEAVAMESTEQPELQEVPVEEPPAEQSEE